MFRAVILDWSGTLVDDMAPTLEATNAVLGKFSQPPLSRDEFRARFRLPYSEFYEEVLPGVSLDELEEHFRAAFRDSAHPVTPLEGTEGFLRWCRQIGVRLFVLTSMDADTFRGQLHDFGFADYFEETYAGVLDKRTKILEILESHDLRPGETAYVGDMVHDVETAHHGGVTPVALLSGYDVEASLRAAAPRFLLSCIGTLHAVMEEAAVLPHAGAGGGVEVIEIRRLAVDTHIGVPDEERASPQTLHVSLVMVPMVPFREMADEVAATVDYEAVANRVSALAAEKPRRLIESLAAEIAELVLDEFSVKEVRVELEKRILPRTDCVAVRTRRARQGGGN